MESYRRIKQALMLNAIAVILNISPHYAVGAIVVCPTLPSCYTTSSELSLTANATNVPINDCSTQFVNYDYCDFSCSGTLTITITARQIITSCSISPLRLGISGKINGNTLTFTLSSPQFLIVHINNLRDLVIAANALEANVPPSLGDGIFNITDTAYNADATGTAMATKAIQSAIDDASAYKGGIVYVPAGVYKCGNLALKSDMSLYLAGGSVIRGTGNAEDYTINYYKHSLGMKGTWFIHTTAGASNIKIYGRGTIDGNGDYMRNRNHFLNNLVVPLACSNFTITGVTLRDSGLWGLTPIRSSNIIIQNTKHFNNNDLDYEDDAMDIEECQHVTVNNSIAVSEDDNYSVKTWDTKTDIAANWPGTPKAASDIVFDNCVAWSRCGAFKIGQGILQPQSNITFENSSVFRCMYAVAIIQVNGTAGASDITYSNIDVEGYWPRHGKRGQWLDATLTSPGSITNVVIANIRTRVVDTTASSLKGCNAAARFYGIHFNHDYYNGMHGNTLKALNVTDTNTFITNLTFK